jgi:predicted metal-dependent hydrolase
VYPQAYLDYLYLFHVERDYFECHEILEEYWKETGQSEDVWVALIQIAVALYHQRRHNDQGATKMMGSALAISRREGPALEKLGLHSQRLINLLEQLHGEMLYGRAYRSIELPLSSEVKALCLQRCTEQGQRWNQESDLSNEYLVNKHTLRDRSDVILARESQLMKKREKRG